MIILKQLYDTAMDVNLNRNEGTVAFILHRLTGLCLAGYIFLHLIIVGSSFIYKYAFYKGEYTFDTLMHVFEWPLVKALEVCLIMVIAFHLANGTRIVLIDLFRIVKTQKILFWTVFALCVAIFVITVYVFLPLIIK